MPAVASEPLREDNARTNTEVRMKRLDVLIVLFALGLLPACRMERGTATIQGTKPGSNISGTATFVPASNGLKVSIRVANVPPGPHGIHLHQNADCGDGGAAAGGHYNPDNVKHGFLPKDGFGNAHAGDLGNIEVHANGSGTLELTLPGLSLQDGPHSVVGRTIILHEKPDDFGQPTGNAGSRIACGVVAVRSR